MKQAMVCLAVLLLIGTVQAHVPIIARDNEGLDNATLIQDPLRSWAVFDRLHEGGEVHYFQFQMEEGQILHINLFTPFKHDFIPSLAIMGPGIRSRGTLPDQIEIPPGAGVIVVRGNQPEAATYEAFTPAAWYTLLEQDVQVTKSGTFYIAVFEPSRGGAYGFAIGRREEFELMEWIRVPVDVISIHRWEGQPLGYILAPMLAVVGIGLLFLWQLRTELNGLFGLAGYTAGLLYIGSGAMMIMQMFIALSRSAPTSQMVITLFFGSIPIIAGIALMILATKERIEPKTRVMMVLLGIAGLFLWAGIIIGPVLAVGAGILPSGKVKDIYLDQGMLSLPRIIKQK